MHKHGTMPAHRRELLVARIVSGTVRLELGGSTYVLGRPKKDSLYVAQQQHAGALYEAHLAGLFTEEELHDFLLDEGLWDEDSEKFLADLPGQIDKLKLALFRAVFRANERKTIRKALKAAREKLSWLLGRRHAYDHLSCQGAACGARAWYLLASSLYDHRGRRVFKLSRFWDEPCGLLQEAASELSRARLAEAEFRELARSEPWRSVWACRNAEHSLFGVSPDSYSEEQRSLAAYSSLYDSVLQHPECPPDEVIADDDCLDGWLVEQREKRKSGTPAGELVDNEKIRNSQEVYLVAETPDDAERVMALNDPQTRAVQKKRFAKIIEKGEVDEMHMPDTKRRFQMEAAAKLSASMKGGA